MQALTTLDFQIGDWVTVDYGIYKDATGVISDVSPDDSVAKILTKDGYAYAIIHTLRKIPRSKFTNPVDWVRNRKAAILNEVDQLEVENNELIELERRLVVG